MKKLLLLTGLVFMTSCHSDRFLQIDAILSQHQIDIENLQFDLKDKTDELSDRLDNLSDNLNDVSSDLRASIDSLGIETNENDLMILQIIYDTIDYVDESFIELNNRITFENQQLQNGIDLNAEDIAAIETNIVELEGELDAQYGELETVITALVQSLHGELLSTVADILREYLTAEYQQILVEVSNTTVAAPNDNDISDICLAIARFANGEAVSNLPSQLDTETDEDYIDRLKDTFDCN